MRVGRLDAALIALPFEIGELVIEQPFDDCYKLAAPRGHDLTAARILDCPASWPTARCCC
ncbi:hypothetical protein [Rhodovibrio sodomensis]|uniref:hypothetical protein n=1 Tax=Rhodovibrio sodomensis TaxID=1088 RepID=UPI0019048FFD|nr:hypothetical protein [Rhodovibrio sodomensis]